MELKSKVNCNFKKKGNGKIIAKMRVMAVKYGFAIVEAETEEEAIEKAKNMCDEEFDWSDPDDVQVADDDVDFE